MAATAAASLALPDDPAELKRLLAERDERLRDRDRRIAELELAKVRLEHELLVLRKRYYGPRADALATAGDVAQLLLDFARELEARPVHSDDLPAGTPEADAKAVRRVRRGRRDLAAFDHLPLVRLEHDLPEEEKPCPCGGTVRQKIGEESSFQAEYVPGRFERVEHVRFKYACKHCEQKAEPPQITLADKPPQPVEKGMAGPGLLAYVVTSKFADYLPLYRLESIFRRNGFEVGRATQSVWCGDVADLVRPVYDLMARRVLASQVVGTDDTVMPMQAAGKARKARMWVYVGDESNPYNVFDFTTSRSRDGPAKFLGNFDQVLLADGYGGYDGVVVGNAIRRAGCWAHARRKFVDAEKAAPEIARAAVSLIRQLYLVEEEAGELDAAARLSLRRARSVPALAALRDRLLAWRQQLLPKHPMAEAVGYALNQWEELTVFARDGAVPVDNNACEREMKRVVLNRKNSLFVGNERGGRTAAVLSSLTSTCRRHGVDPQRYFTQLLTNLPSTPTSQLGQWLPDVWRRNQPSPIPPPA